MNMEPVSVSPPGIPYQRHIQQIDGNQIDQGYQTHSVLNTAHSSANAQNDVKDIQASNLTQLDKMIQDDVIQKVQKLPNGDTAELDICHDLNLFSTDRHMMQRSRMAELLDDD